MKSWSSTAAEVVERGRFDSLVARGGRFAQLVATQLAGAPQIRAAE